MAVSIPISANAQGVKDALREIEAAIARAGQTGRTFAQLDFSHPELQKFSAEIIRVQQRLDDLARVGRGATASAVRAFAQGGSVNAFGPGGFLTGGLGNIYPSPATAQRILGQAGTYAFQGTRWQAPPGGYPPQQPPPQPPAGGGGGGGQGGGGGGGGGSAAGMLASLARGAGSFAIASLAMAGLHSVKQVIGESIGKGQDEAIANDTLMRHMTEGVTDFTDLREAVRKTTEGLGLTYQESQRLSLHWAKLTNDSSPEAMSAGVRLSAGVARGFGIDPDAAAQTLGRAQYLGMDPRRFAVTAGDTAASGRQTGQIEEVMGALLRWSESASRTLVNQTMTGPFAEMYAGLNAQGAADKLPGLRGQNAENIINTLNASLMHGGNAGAASQALTYQALSAQGVRNPYDIQYLTEGGMFASPRGELGYGSTTSVFSATMEQLQKQYAGLPQNMLLNAMENHLGLNMRQSKALLDYSPGDINASSALINQSGVRMQDLNPTGIRDIIGLSHASDADLEGWRTRLLGRTGSTALDEGQRATLTSAGPDDLRTVMAKIIARQGAEVTEGSETREAIANVSNAMTKVGELLLTPLNMVRDYSALFVGGIGDIGNILRDIYKATTLNDAGAKARLASDNSGVLGQLGFTGSKGSDEAGFTSELAKARQHEAMQFFQSKAGGSYTADQAAGLVAGAMSESGMQIHGKRGDGGLAAELYQWHPDRQKAIEAHFGKKLEDMGFEEQLAAKAWELSEGGPEAAAGRNLRLTTSARSAGYHDTVDDQRPAYAPIQGIVRAERADRIAREEAELQVRIIHEDTHGNILHEQTVPATDYGPPIPWGPGGAQKAPLPPPPKAKTPAVVP